MKLNKISLILAISCLTLLSSCSLSTVNKQTNNSDNASSSETNDTTSEKTTSSKVTQEKDSKSSSNNKDNLQKNKYLEKLNKIESGLSDLDSYKAGTTLDMKYAATEEYNRWDTALNEIYETLKNTLSSADMSKLEKEELEWISEKEKKAKEEADLYKGGTLEGVVHTTSLAKSTKDRCYKLVNDYM